MRNSTEVSSYVERRGETVDDEGVAETDYARSSFDEETKMLEPFAEFRARLNLKRPAARNQNHTRWLLAVLHQNPIAAVWENAGAERSHQPVRGW